MQNFHRTVLQLWHRLQPIQPFYWNISQQYFNTSVNNIFGLLFFTQFPAPQKPENTDNACKTFLWRSVNQQYFNIKFNNTFILLHSYFFHGISCPLKTRK